MRIALAGNPNSGKTTLFNAITGKIEYVGNWAGVTVEKKEGDIKKEFTNDELIRAVDLPGAYSISPFTTEESITSSYVKDENIDVIINIIDATSLNRSLLFTTQLLELGIPLVVALNKSDLTSKKKIDIDIKKLEQKLGCRVVETSATNNNGLKELMDVAISVVGSEQTAPFDGERDFDSEDTSLSEKVEIERFAFVDSIVNEVEIRQIDDTKQNRQDKIDRVVASKVWGIPIFALVMFSVFAISQTYLGTYIADYFVGLIDNFYVFVEGLLGASVNPVLKSILLDGIIGGVGAVVGFLPLIMILFFLLALLEDCGYMARVAVVWDGLFKKVGLSGKSIIPMIVGTGCAIPGIMATRTIQNERQRRTTAMLTPFMPCGAKLPVIALFAGVFFQEAAWVGTLMYFVGILLIIVGALVIKKIVGDDTVKTYFIMELPEYRFPSIKRATISMCSRGKAFVVKAATIILVCNAIIQIMSTFNWQFEVVEAGMESTSILASIATPFAFILIPLGFGVWQLAAASITGFIAKENVVGTIAVVYGITNFIDTEELALVSGASDVKTIIGLSSAAALSCLMFNLFTPPCFAAIGAMNSEMESKKWFWGGIAFLFATGYIVAFLVYQIGTLITMGQIGDGFIEGLIIVTTFVSIIAYFMFRKK